MTRKRQFQKPVDDITPGDLPDLPHAVQARHPLARRVLSSMVNAKLPRDFTRFAPFAEIFRHTDAGQTVIREWRSEVGAQSVFPNLHKYEAPPAELFLPLLQIHLLKSACARRREDVGPTESPKVEELEKKLGKEIHPLRRRELEDRIEKERAAAKAAAEKNEEQRRDHFMRCLMKWSKRQDRTPHVPDIRLWFEPMTVRDYVEATAVSRKTVEEFLGIRKGRNRARRSRATPLNPNKKVNEPFIYGTEPNLCVLRQWICVWLKDVEQCRTCLACTLAYCKAHSPDRVRELLGALSPDLEHTLTRICPTHESLHAFVAEVQKLVRHYAPPAPPPQPVLDLDSLYSLGALNSPLLSPPVCDDIADKPVGN